MKAFSSSDELAFDNSTIVVHTFDEGGRFYHLDAEKVYPSVTTIISRIYGDPFPEAARGHVEHALERGVEWHRSVALLSGVVPGMTANLETMDPEVLPRVLMVREWMNERGWVAEYIERAFYSHKYRIAGVPDQVGRFRLVPRLWILDFKPWTAPRAALQLAGYSLMVRECLNLDYVPGRISLHIGKAIKEEQHMNHSTDKNAFLSALNCYNYGMGKKLWLKDA